jgi:hypothetical protein
MRNVPVTCILQLNGTSRVFEPLNLGALHNDTHCIAIDALQGRHGTDSGFHDLAPVVEYDSLKSHVFINVSQKVLSIPF